MKRIKRKPHKIIPFIIVISTFILSIILVLSLSLTKNSKEIIRSKAEGDPNPKGSPAWCADHCNPSPETNPCNQNTTYKFPDCCNELAGNGDPFACGWPDRGYCLDSQCASIPGDSPREKCGGPKHSWCGECTTGNCPGYGAPTPTKTSSPAPTTPPQPTTEPTTSPEETQPPEPTTIIRTPPNETPRPVNNNTFQESRSQSVSQQFELPLIQFPKISLPKMNINLIKVNLAVRKPLDFFEYLFGKVIYYDKLLEKNMNNKLNDILY